MSNELLKLNETTDDQLVMIREFSAPKTLVFDALTLPKHIKQWHCPPSMEVTFSKVDLKVGGKYSLGMKGAQGPEMRLIGEYKEIEAPTRLVYTQSMQMPDGSIRGPETLITITLEEDDNKTQMIFHHSGFASKQERDNSSMGWPAAFDKLQNLVHSLV